MSTEAQTYQIDRAGWPAGPWDAEPDRVDFRHQGLPCLLLRNYMGVWCGYVGLPPGHPWHGLEYRACLTPADPAHADNEDGWHECDQRPDALVRVHCGLTYSEPCQGHICHVPEPGESDNAWWLGFDCCHAWDLWPGMPHSGRAAYRDLAYAREQAEQLAEQLAAVGP